MIELVELLVALVICVEEDELVLRDESTLVSRLTRLPRRVDDGRSDLDKPGVGEVLVKLMGVDGAVGKTLLVLVAGYRGGFLICI